MEATPTREVDASREDADARADARATRAGDAGVGTHVVLVQDARSVDQDKQRRLRLALPRHPALHAPPHLPGDDPVAWHALALAGSPTQGKRSGPMAPSSRAC